MRQDKLAKGIDMYNQNVLKNFVYINHDNETI